ncbi:metallophosphoesterase family protein [Bradyrhizobium sp. Pear76]|uniref:metallophosphoesterase family protein n=1 Tax=Bradyrhizobium oropedii TaxID=1571201 RepID=UPI001E406017|nr:metallophosphoesterase family protein [Bradyrhizobium oropedii]MCC8962472.1 metallophosphoesterase family protein [Bradyrhizobium oropedii]
MAVFLIADTHFGHAGIIRMCRRPFADVREMDATMIANWNAVVRQADDVIHLGDFAHRYDAAKLPKLFASLNGRKHLIKGNHDDAATLALPWESVRDIAYASIDSQNVVLCHYAMRTWPRIRKGALMLYGHSHGRLAGNVQSCDVGVDVLGFAPVRLKTIKSYLATLPLMNDPEAREEIDNDDGGLKL